VDMRDPNEQRLAASEAHFSAFLMKLAQDEGVRISAERLARFSPVVFDAELADVIEASASGLGLSSKRMTSGAGHDAQMIARIAPAAMIFVPSRGGVSHNPREHTDDEQLVNGAKVLLDVVARRLGVHR
ncbi:MAG: M20/M25/M40 family metallo-hydrolase, partial [Pandoraea sp.]|nr:M20/M25/M40 family metallo-hydrolase [Pandoraea sp.]